MSGRETGRRTRVVLLILVGLGFGLRLSAGSDRYLHPWDERYHALVADNLLENPLRPTLRENPVLPYDYRNWWDNHVWVHKPPLALWTLAAGIALGGGHELVMRLPTILLSSLAILFTFAIGRGLWGAPSGLAAAALHALYVPLINLTGGRSPTDHVDSLLVVWVLAGAWLSFRHARTGRRRELIGVGICTGLGLLTKGAVALLIPLLWLAAAERRRPTGRIRALAVLLGVACALFLPWQLHVWSSFPSEAAWESRYTWRHLFETLEGHAAPWWYYGTEFLRDFGPMFVLPLAWFGIRIVRRREPREATAIAVWVCVPYVVYTVAQTKMPAYVAPAAPALLLVGGAFLSRAVALARDPARRGALRLTAAMAALLVVIPIPARAGTHAVEVLESDRTPRWACEVRGLGQRVQRRWPDRRPVVFGVEHDIEAMFYSGLPVYAQLPTPEQIDRLTERGYQVVVKAEQASAAGLPVDGRVGILPREEACGDEVSASSLLDDSPRRRATVSEGEAGEP